MNKSEKEIREAKRKLDKAAIEGIKNITKEKAELIFKLQELYETLKKIEEFEVIGLRPTVEKYEKKLKSFEGFIDKKYWNKDAIVYMNLSIMCNVAQNIEEAIAGYEDYLKIE